MKRILILSANPHDTDHLDLSKEERDIREELKRSRHRDQFELISRGAVGIQDFYNHMVEVEPNILHFCGHGGGEHGLVLQDDSGKAQFLQTEQLAGLFKLFADLGLECVVLNACYSEVQANAMSQFIPYVIGMNQTIGDRAAMTFAKTFYAVLGAGKGVDFAFEVAKTRLMEYRSDQKIEEIELLVNSDLAIKLEPSFPPTANPRKLALKLLESLSASQFNSVVFNYEIPPAQISSQMTAQSIRATEVIAYAEQKEDSSLTELFKIIYEVAPNLEGKYG